MPPNATPPIDEPPAQEPVRDYAEPCRARHDAARR